jgi:hypothetical protein
VDGVMVGLDGTGGLAVEYPWIGMDRHGGWGALPMGVGRIGRDTPAEEKRAQGD